MELLKKKVQTFASTKRGRGLHYDEGVKNQKSSRLPGSGEYNTVDPLSMQGKLKQQLSRRSPMKAKNNMSTASREVSFTKYSSINSKIYGNGLF